MRIQTSLAQDTEVAPCHLDDTAIASQPLPGPLDEDRSVPLAALKATSEVRAGCEGPHSPAARTPALLHEVSRVSCLSRAPGAGEKVEGPAAVPPRHVGCARGILTVRDSPGAGASGRRMSCGWTDTGFAVRAVGVGQPSGRVDDQAHRAIVRLGALSSLLSPALGLYLLPLFPLLISPSILPSSSLPPPPTTATRINGEPHLVRRASHCRLDHLCHLQRRPPSATVLEGPPRMPL